MRTSSARRAYVQALRAAARDGVDVRLLVPGASDIPALSPLSRAGYRPLLDAGVRVFEWNGTMLHAKTAVADGLWARVGSTNLNLASWMGNYELDVAIEDRGFGAIDGGAVRDAISTRATEIVLTRPQSRARADRESRPPSARRARAMSGSAGRAAAGAVSVGSALGAALTNRRTLGPAEVGPAREGERRSRSHSRSSLRSGRACVAWPLGRARGVARHRVAREGVCAAAQRASARRAVPASTAEPGATWRRGAASLI